MIQPLISVIVPVYNVEKYICRCLDSILNQTYSNLEIIIIDDGSTDHSGRICDAYAEKDNRVIVIHEHNRGVSGARNKGIDASSGEYLSFVDGDDFIDQDMLQTLFLAMQKDKSDIACCNYLQVDEHGKPFGNYLPIKDGCVDCQDAINFFIMLGGYYVVLWNKLYKSSVFQSLRFPIGKRYEDLFVFPQIINQCKKISHIHKALYYWVRHSDSFTMSTFNISSFDFIESMINMYNFACEYHNLELKSYCIERISYKLEDCWKEKDSCLEYEKRYKEIKKRLIFIIFRRTAWKNLNIKGKVWNRIVFLFS